MTSEIRHTPLHQFHIDHGARMVPFAGWAMPVQYSSIINEHNAVRQTAGLFDVSHMGEALVSGPEAIQFLDYIATNNVTHLKDGQARYTIMCLPEGGCVDDIIIYRYTQEKYLICLNASNTARDIQWLQQHCGGYDCTVEDVSADYAQLAMQGPKAEEVLSHVTDTCLQDIGYFHFAEGMISSASVMIARTGYTGETGFEIYLAPERAVDVAELLFKEGQAYGLSLVGLGARDSLRLEMGYSLYGHEMSEYISPLQANLAWAVKIGKSANFIGKTSLRTEREAGIKKKIVFFKMKDRRIARKGTPVFEDSKQVGEVTSGTHSPSLNQPIGSALVDINASESKNLTARIRNKNYPLEIVSPPFVKTSLTQ